MSSEQLLETVEEYARYTGTLESRLEEISAHLAPYREDGKSAVEAIQVLLSQTESYRKIIGDLVRWHDDPTWPNSAPAMRVRAFNHLLNQGRDAWNNSMLPGETPLAFVPRTPASEDGAVMLSPRSEALSQLLDQAEQILGTAATQKMTVTEVYATLRIVRDTLYVLVNGTAKN